MIGELEACSYRDAPPVKPIKGVTPYIVRKFTGLTYSGYKGESVRLDFQLYHSLSECL
jgi:hypothetical protein